MLYKDAKNKDRQIEILCQLTGLRTFEVEKILEEGGYLNTMTDLMKDRIVDLYNQGLSDSAIGRELKVAQSQVSTFLRGKGLPPNSRKKSKKKVEDKKVSNEKVEPIKEAVPAVNTLEKLKEETKKNFEELKEILPKSIPEVTEENAGEWKTGESIDMIETLTPTQYYELAKLTFEILKGIWGC